MGDFKGQGHRVLVVEDNDGDARLLSILLREAVGTADVRTEPTLARALAAVQEQTFDIVFCDLNLPDSSGTATIAAMAEALVAVPLIAISGLSDRETALASLDAGAQNFLVKGDISPIILSRTLTQALRAKRSEVQHVRARFIVENALDGFWVCDLDGNLQDVNDALCQMVGFDRDILLGTTVYALECGTGMADNLAAILASGGARFEARYTRRDGAQVDVEVAAHYRAEEGGQILALVRDVTERRRDQDALREREQRLAAILGAVADAVISIDDSGIIHSFNPAAEAIFGWPQHDVVGRNVTMLMPEPYASGHQGYIRNYLRSGAPKVIGIGRELVGLRRDGSTFPMALTVTEATLEEPRLFIGVIRDITERKAMEDNLRRLATTDPLTGASNRRHFMDALAEELARAKRYGHPLAVAMVDIDHFKRLNDAYGHAAGDAALIAFVAEIQARLRGSDLLGRLGGEEFALLMPETTAEAGYIVVDALRAARAAVVLEHEGRDIRFTISAGVADTSHASTAEALLAAADSALYRSKHEGRNQVMVADLVSERG